MVTGIGEHPGAPLLRTLAPEAGTVCQLSQVLDVRRARGPVQPLGLIARIVQLLVVSCVERPMHLGQVVHGDHLLLDLLRSEVGSATRHPRRGCVRRPARH